MTRSPVHADQARAGPSGEETHHQVVEGQTASTSPQSTVECSSGTPSKHPIVPLLSPPLAVGAAAPLGMTTTTPSRQLQSVGTQHDELTYAQWFYTELRPLTATQHATLPQVNVGGANSVPSAKRRRTAHLGSGGISSFVSGSTVVTDPNHHNLIKDFVVPAGFPNMSMVSHPSTNDFTPDRRVPTMAKSRRRRPDQDGKDARGTASSLSDDSSAPTDCSDSTEGEGGAAYSETDDSIDSQGVLRNRADSVEPPQQQPPTLLAVNSEASELASLSSAGAERPSSKSSTPVAAAPLPVSSNENASTAAREGSLGRLVPRAVGEEQSQQPPANEAAADGTQQPHVVQHSQIGSQHQPQPSYQNPSDVRRSEHHHHHQTQHDGNSSSSRHGGNSGPVNFVTSCLCPPSLAAELEAYALLRLQLRQDEQRDRNRYISLIERVVQNVLGKRATVTVHGSFATGVALQSSDIDVLVRHYEPTQPLVAIERVSNALYMLESYDIPDLSGNAIGTPAAGTPGTLPQSSDATTQPASAGATEFPSDPQQRQRSEGAVTTSPSMTPSSTPTTSAPHLPMGTGGSLFDPSATMTRHGQILAVQTIVATRVPVVKVREILTGHRCDVSFGGGEHFPSMELTKSLLSRHASARSLLLLLKYVVKKMQIGETEPGGITSFPLYLLAIHFYEHGLLMIHKIRNGGVMPSSMITSPSIQPTTPSTATHESPSTVTKSPQQRDEDKRKLVQQTLQHAMDSAAAGQGVSDGGKQQQAPQHIMDTIGSYLYGAECVVPEAAAAAEAQELSAGRASSRAHSTDSLEVVAAQPPAGAGGADDASAAPTSPIPLSTSPPPPPPPATASPISTPASIESSSTIGQIVLDFCVYYAYLFDYERHGIRFAADGTSAVVEKPPQCNARGQHLHMTGPFDPRADITARMAHTREFQAMCGGIATILNGGTLTHLLTWVSPESIHDDLNAVYHYLQATMPHLYPAAAAAAAVAAASQHQAAVYSQQHYSSQQHRHHGRHHHASSSGMVGGAYGSNNNNNNSSMNVLVGANGQLQQGRPTRHHPTSHGNGAFSGAYHDPNGHHMTSGPSALPVPGDGVPGGANNAASRSPHLVGLGYVNPYARSNTPVVQQHHPMAPNAGYPNAPTMAQHMASLTGSTGSDAPPYASSVAGGLSQHMSGVTTGTMTTLPQAPPMQIPPLQTNSNRPGQVSSAVVQGSAASSGGPAMYVSALIGAPSTAAAGSSAASFAAHLHHHQHHHHHHHHMTFAAPATQQPPPQQGNFVQAVPAGYATAAAAAVQPQQPLVTPPTFPSVQPQRRPSSTSAGAATTPRPFAGSVVASAEAVSATAPTVQPTVATQPSSLEKETDRQSVKSSSVDTTKETPKDAPVATLSAKQKSKAKKAKAAADAASGAAAPSTTAGAAAPSAGTASQKAVKAAATVAPAANTAAAAGAIASTSATPTAPAQAAPKKPSKKRKPSSTAETEASTRPPSEQAVPSSGGNVRRGGGSEAHNAASHAEAPLVAPPKQRQPSAALPPTASNAVTALPQSPVTVTVTVNTSAANAAKYVPPFRRMQLEEQHRQGPSQ
jgi:predicted nucleotidyltransferase